MANHQTGPEHSLNSLAQLFSSSAQQFPERAALWVDGQSYSYAQLHLDVVALAGDIDAAAALAGRACERVAIFGLRTYAAYCSLLGVLEAGRTYVPLNPKFPAARNARVLAVAQAKLLLVDGKFVDEVEPLLREAETGLVVLLVGCTRLPAWAPNLPQHRFVLSGAEHRTAPAQAAGNAPVLAADALAYVMFTSGSTGLPKGVAVTHANVLAYLREVQALLKFTPEDRFTQLFDFTFDLSVHDLFACWQVGACLYCVPSAEVMLPNAFVVRHQLTVWFSVPSAAGLLRSFRRLKADAMPSLRLSLFCGEALPREFAEAWQIAAPNSQIFNLYGPTEATIAITAFAYTSTCVLSTVPIGFALSGQAIRVVDEHLQPVAVGDSGELLLGGSQIAAGYFNEPRLTAERFVKLPGIEGCWYRTGDVVSEHAEYGLLYHGRADRQVKIRGYRIELQEIENLIRETAETALVAVLPISDPQSKEVSHLVAFVARSEVDSARIVAACEARLPKFMVPNAIHRIDELPYNANGKVDYGALSRMLTDQVTA